MGKGAGGGKGGKRKGLDFFLGLALIGVTAFIVGYLLFASPDRRTAPSPKMPPRALPPKAGDAAPKAGRRTRAAPGSAGRVAIIIDDMGSDTKALSEILSLDAPVAVAVLPHAPRSAETARLAKAAGREVLLHLPMQPKGGSLKGLGRGALMSGMGEDELRETLSQDFASVPGAVGVNNHMGSLLTEDPEAMGTVMDALRKRGMFFVDSKTSHDSVAVEAARRRGVRAAARKVFLDDTDDPEEIRRQIDRLARVARKDGEAIAIGHPRPATLRALRGSLPALREQGLDVVAVSRLTR